MIGRPNTVKQKLQAGETALGMVCRTLSPAVVELIGLAGFDYVWIDMEHTSADFGLVENLCRAADAADVCSLVRVPEKHPSYILRALESGAGIVNVPQVENRSDTECVVRAAKYYPLGERGYCSSSRGTVYGMNGKAADSFAAANERVLVMTQIESLRGVENAEDICSVPGVDIVFIGVGDLSQSLGCIGQFDHPDLLGCVRKVLGCIKESGKIAAMQAESLESARRWHSEGVLMFCCGVDITALGRTLKVTRQEFGVLR
ncbi:MAG TPA: aldolase/citrate lyase family protein [Blastocatellia bacterium]|nr:aldolase/citrate lyase family protein [Blastocatellia bacterium]